MADDDKPLPTAVEQSIEQVPSPGTDAADTGGSLLDAVQRAVPELRQDDTRRRRRKRGFAIPSRKEIRSR